MSKGNDWAARVLSLIKSGNTDAAIAQIKVAPTVKDLKALKTLMIMGKLGGRWRNLDEAIDDNLALLSAPRLHRAP